MEKIQYGINSQAAAMSALSSDKIYNQNQEI